jgi:hypothetical protein
MASYAIQLWLQNIWDIMLGPRCSQNKKFHGHKVATKGKIEVIIHIWTSNFFLNNIYGHRFSYFNYVS